ncbi:C-terminal binding protein [Chloroflexota bacterium]
MSLKIVITLPVDYPGIPNFGEKEYRDLDATLEKKVCRTEDELIDIAGDADAVITGGEPYSRRVIERLAKCRIISNIGIGYDGVDVEAATERGICVANVPDYCIEEMADHTIALLLACARKLVRLDKAVKEGKWDSVAKVTIRSEVMRPTFRLSGQTLGLIGLGRIPRCVVPRAKALGLEVTAFDPYIPKDIAEEAGVELVDLERLLTESDFVSVHAALTPESRQMMNAEAFGKMKSTAYFINTARGALVDEEALRDALSRGIIAGAGLDVMDPEPPSLDNPLLHMDNVIVTAHSANYSEDSAAELRRRPEEDVFRVLRGEWPRGFVNPQVKDDFVARWKG